MHRFFVAEENLRGQQVVLTGRQAHQIRNVLRMKSGDHIIVLDNTGCEYTVALTKVGWQDVVCEVISKQQAQAEPRTQITLYQSLLAREKFEWVLQKCTEVGVASFVPIVTKRSIVRGQGAITPRKLSRWRDIITEAAEQSGRGRIPQLDAPVNFVDAVSRISDFDRCLIGSPGAAGSSVREILRNGNAKPVTVALFIGPEGGFTDEEIADACSKGATAFSLGKRILRTETAAVVASAVILYELGELIP
jgi:16S rRNA (uracil1498-N3)-methyltransferase